MRAFKELTGIEKIVVTSLIVAFIVFSILVVYVAIATGIDEGLKKVVETI